MNPAVSVVIPVYNGAATIGDTLRSLLAQSGPAASREIIVVDNGSTDATREIARSFDVTLAEEATRGPAAARNRGLALARGEIIAHCDADTIVTRRWLAEIVAPLRDPETALVTGETLAYRPATGPERYAAASGLFDGQRAATREKFPFAPSLNMAVRRADALAAGGWDDTLATGEDVDFSHRVLLLPSYAAHSAGAQASRIAYASKAVLFHRNRASDEAFRDQARSYGRGAAQLYLRHPRTLAWTPKMSLVLARTLAVRGVAPPVLAALARVRLASHERVEFATYHRIWVRAFWKGFAEEFRAGRARPPRRCSCG